MQGQVKLFKITSKKFPDKEWDSINHFYSHHEDRQIVKDEKKYRKDSNFKYSEFIKATGYINRPILSKDKKTIVKLIVADQRIHEYTHKNYDQPHIDKGILEIKEIFSIDVKLTKLNQLVDFLEKFLDTSDDEWEKFLQQIK